MEINLDSVKFALSVLTFMTTIGVMVYQHLSHQKIVGNDLHHLALDLKKISENQDKQGDKINALCTDMAYIKGRNETNDKIIQVLEKNLTKKVK